MQHVRFGIIGFGSMGHSHGEWIFNGKVPRARLTAVCDIDPKRLELAKEEYSDSVVLFSDAESLFASKLVDAVIISVPHYDHSPLAIKALKAGLHIMVEKPAGVYTQQVIAMNEEAEKHPELSFAMMFNQRMNPLYIRIKALLDAGTIGELRRVSWMITTWWRTKKYYESSSWRASWAGEGGGVLVNQAPHQLDLLQWFFGTPSCMHGFAKFGKHRNITVEDDVTAYFEYPNGATGTFITCTHDPIGTDRLEIFGNLGKIIVEGSAKVTVKRLKESEEELNEKLGFKEVLSLLRGEGGEKLYTEEIFNIPERWDVQHIDTLINFVEHVLDEKPLIAPGNEGVKAVEIANAILLSSWLGERVNFPIDANLYCKELQKNVEEERKLEKI